MSRRAALVTEADVVRVLRAAEKVAPGRFRVRVTKDGEIVAEPIGVAAPSETEEMDAPTGVARGLEVVP